MKRFWFAFVAVMIVMAIIPSVSAAGDTAFTLGAGWKSSGFGFEAGYEAQLGLEMSSEKYKLLAGVDYGSADKADYSVNSTGLSSLMVRRVGRSGYFLGGGISLSTYSGDISKEALRSKVAILREGKVLRTLVEGHLPIDDPNEGWGVVGTFESPIFRRSKQFLSSESADTGTSHEGGANLYVKFAYANFLTSVGGEERVSDSSVSVGYIHRFQ
jgi:hypothetical protein